MKMGFLLLFAIPTLAAIYYAMTLPVSYDEAVTFLFFTQKDISVSVSTYPLPNNHVLHSVITHFTSHLPFLSDLFKLRISSIIINLATLIVLYQFIAKHFNPKMAVTIVAITSVLFMSIYYSYMSRGYALLNLFFILNLNCAFNIIKEDHERKNWWFFGICSVLGFYTIPAFLYPFITLNVFILILHRQSIWKQIVVNSIVLLLVVALYAPIIYNEGIAAVTNNSYVKPIGFLSTLRSLPKFYLKTLQDISGIHWFVILILLLFSSYTVIKSNDRITKWLVIVFILSPFVLLILHGVIPFTRVFFYYNSILVLLICLSMRNRIEQLSYKALVPFLLLIQCLLLLNFERKIYTYEDKDDAINITSDVVIKKIIGNKKYLLSGALLSQNLEFDLITKGYKNYEIKDFSELNVSADTIRYFDYMIINKKFDKTKSKKPFLTTDYHNIYKK